MGVGGLTTNQVSVANVATQIVAARNERRSLLIINHGTTDVFIGDASVTIATGVKLKGSDGAAISIPTISAIYGIVAAGTQMISYIEIYLPAG